jgi:hypothetical protein
MHGMLREVGGGAGRSEALSQREPRRRQGPSGGTLGLNALDEGEMSTAHHVVAADEHFYVSTVAYRPFLPQPSRLPREKGQAG